MKEIKKKYPKQKMNFYKGYFDAFNNPQRNLKDYDRVSNRVNELLTHGKLTQSTSNYFDGKTQALRDRNLM